MRCTVKYICLSRKINASYADHGLPPKSGDESFQNIIHPDLGLDWMKVEYLRRAMCKFVHTQTFPKDKIKLKKILFPWILRTEWFAQVIQLGQINDWIRMRHWAKKILQANKENLHWSNWNPTNAIKEPSETKDISTHQSIKSGTILRLYRVGFGQPTVSLIIAGETGPKMVNQFGPNMLIQQMRKLVLAFGWV